MKRVNNNIGKKILNLYWNIIGPYIDIQMFNFKYPTMNRMQVLAGAISKLLYGFCACTDNIPLAKACGLSFCTDAQTTQ